MSTHSITEKSVLKLFVDAMTGYESSAYRIEQTWSKAAGMWFTELHPAVAGPVSISLAQGTDMMTISFGYTTFEYPGFTPSAFAELPAILSALVEGRFEENGSPKRSRARIYLPKKTMHVGHLALPGHWNHHSARRYQPYPYPPTR